MNGHEWLKASAAAPGAGRGDGRAEGRLASRGHQADAREGSVFAEERNARSAPRRAP